ncbi:MAG TPA: hydrogenase [Anaeromyxobacteraceae bacterium]|nr:hydrogenase [Anaeromyxobacteraceae bacterium]
MRAPLDLVLVLVVLVDFFLLASSRPKTGIRAVAVQGALLAALPVLLAGNGLHAVHVVALAAGALVVKAIAIPLLMNWATRESAPHRELAPIVGYASTLFFGAVGAAVAFTWTSDLPLPIPGRHPMLVPTAITTAWTGLLLLMTRRKAVTQVLGFLVLENGVFVFGQLLADLMPVMVEAGVLLDLLAAVFVMGLVMFDLQRAFSSLDTSRLTTLKD